MRTLGLVVGGSCLLVAASMSLPTRNNVLRGIGAAGAAAALPSNAAGGGNLATLETTEGTIQIELKALKALKLGFR